MRPPPRRTREGGNVARYLSWNVYHGTIVGVTPTQRIGGDELLQLGKNRRERLA
jgi:hypothetical protein